MRSARKSRTRFDGGGAAHATEPDSHRFADNSARSDDGAVPRLLGERAQNSRVGASEAAL